MMVPQGQVDYICSCGHRLADHPPEEHGQGFVHRCSIKDCNCNGYAERL